MERRFLKKKNWSTDDMAKILDIFPVVETKPVLSNHAVETLMSTLLRAKIRK